MDLFGNISNWATAHRDISEYDMKAYQECREILKKINNILDELLESDTISLEILKDSEKLKKISLENYIILLKRKISLENNLEKQQKLQNEFIKIKNEYEEYLKFLKNQLLERNEEEKIKIEISKLNSHILKNAHLTAFQKFKNLKAWNLDAFNSLNDSIANCIEEIYEKNRKGFRL